VSALDDLRGEFEAEDGSFLLQLRVDLTWDPVAFDRMTALMLEVVKARESEAPIPRWLAEGFWFVDSSVKDMSTHPNFPRPFDDQYYDRAYRRLFDLAYWLFRGESPYQGGEGFEKLQPGQRGAV
jgi:hypothetical protein